MSWGLNMPCFKGGDGRIAFKDPSAAGGGRVIYRGEPPFMPKPIRIEVTWSPASIGAIPSCGNYHEVRLVAMSVDWVGGDYVVDKPTAFLNPGQATAGPEVSAELDTDCAYPDEDPDGTITFQATQDGVNQLYVASAGCGCVTRGGPGHKAVTAVVTITEGRLSGLAIKGT